MFKQLFAVAMAFAVLLALVATAFGASKPRGYTSPATNVQAKLASKHGRLANTGLDLALVVALGGLLVATGVVVRRANRDRA